MRLFPPEQIALEVSFMDCLNWPKTEPIYKKTEPIWPVTAGFEEGM